MKNESECEQKSKNLNNEKLLISQFWTAELVIRSLRNQRISTGVVTLIKANGQDLCGGVVVRRSRMRLDVDIRSI